MSYAWVELNTVLAIHDQQIATHGGTDGVRDLGLIESALARPKNLSHYDDPTIAELAAAYGFGLTKNHGFVDGNKRTAYVVTRLFLQMHGYDFTASPVNRVLAFEKLGAGGYTADEFADWMIENTFLVEPNII